MQQSSLEMLFTHYVNDGLGLSFLCHVGFRHVHWRMGMDVELNGIIFLLVGKMSLMKLSINDVPRRTETTRFPTIPNTTRMLLSPIPKYNTFFPRTSTFHWSHSSSVGYGSALSTGANRVRQGFLAADVFRSHRRRHSDRVLVHCIQDRANSGLVLFYEQSYSVGIIVHRPLRTVPWKGFGYRFVSCMVEQNLRRSF